MTKEKIRLGSMELDSRFVRSATELFCSLPSGHVNPRELEIYRGLSDKGLGLIISAHTCVSPEGRSNKGQNAIWSDEFIPDAADIAEAAKAHGSKAIMQLGHGGAKAGGESAISPDSMTLCDIERLAAAFASAAMRAKTAGFDGVQLHCAHGYLLSQFYRADKNHRQDGYGGSPKARSRFVVQILAAIKRLCGESFPVLVKVDSADGEHSEEYYQGLCATLEELHGLGAEAAEISGYSSSPSGIPKGPYFLDVASRLCRDVRIPIMLVGGIRTPADVDAAFAAGIKTVSFSRPLLREPWLVSKLLAGGSAACESCNACFGNSAVCVKSC